MNQKILGIAYLMVAVLFIAVFAAVNTDAAAASGSSSAGQTITLIVKSTDHNGTSNSTQNYTNNTQRDIALKINPTNIKMTTNGNNSLAGEIAYSSTELDRNIYIKNAGNVSINLLVRSASTQFSDGGSNVFTPTSFTINSQDGSSVDILTTNVGIAVQMPADGSESHFGTYLTLGIPFYASAGNYYNQLTYTAIESN
jgi:hypothetical protein